jgi:putative membrane protein
VRGCDAERTVTSPMTGLRPKEVMAMHNDGWMVLGGGMMLGWTLLAVLLVGLVVWLVVTRTQSRAGEGGASARTILAERYARGELDADEYARRLSALR